MITCNTDPL